MQQLWSQGGVVLGAIVVASTLGWALALWKWLQLRAEGGGAAAVGRAVVGHARQAGAAAALGVCRSRRGVVARVLAEALGTREPERRWFERHLQPLLEAEREAMGRHLGTIAAVAGALPLLGLLGTVMGMQETFHALMEHGSVQADHLAGGISRALVTTQAGLLMAMPLLLLHGYLSARAQRVLETATLYVKQVETLRCHD